MAEGMSEYAGQGPTCEPINGIAHPCPFDYWRCQHCPWEDIDKGESRYTFGPFLMRKQRCPVCGGPVCLQADQLQGQ